MSTEENKALIRRFYEEIDQGNLAAMDELVAEDYLDHNPPPFPGLRPGREGLKQAFKIFWDATPGYHRVEDQIAEGDKVVTRLTAVGKHEGDLPGAPRTGNDLEMTSITIHRIADGKLAEKWAEKDALGFLQQVSDQTATCPTCGRPIAEAEARCVRWEYKELTIPLNFQAKSRVPSPFPWGRPGGFTTEHPTVTFNRIVDQHLQQVGDEGWQADGPTDLPSLTNAGRISMERKSTLVGPFPSGESTFTYHSATIRLKRQVG